MDTFTYDWHNEVNWEVFHHIIIPQTIKHVQSTRTRGTLNVLQWVSGVNAVLTNVIS